MNRRRRWSRIVPCAALLVLAAGCSPKFAYRPNAPLPGPKIPKKVAVVAFRDGTPEWKSNGSFFGGYVFNLAKAGINGLSLNTGAAFSVSPLPPALWAKSLSEDLAASGVFPSVRFVFDRSELSGEDLVVEGEVRQATFHAVKNESDEFALHLLLTPGTGGLPLLEREIRRVTAKPSDVTDFFGGYKIPQVHAYLAGVMKGMFAEARGAIVAAVEAPEPPASPPEAPGSPEEVIRGILGKP
ncbi:MAG: hypothetical protein Kow00128_18560 [Deltaproteobacteria bacterium]